MEGFAVMLLHYSVVRSSFVCRLSTERVGASDRAEAMTDTQSLCPRG